MHDAIVVGAGPAGCATAIHLARGGLSVALIERAKEPRRKACGEGLFPLGTLELERLGVADRISADAARLDQLRFHAGGRVASAHLGTAGVPALGVRRGALEQVLVEAVREAGVEIREGTAVRSLVVHERTAAGVELATGERVTGRVIVAADGLHSRIRRQIGLDRGGRGDRYGVSAHVRMKFPPDSRIEVYFEDGYELYLTPVGGGLVNAAVLLGRGGMRRFAGRIEPGFRELLAGHPAMARGFAITDAPLAAGPFPAAARRVWRANVVLVGDAAGFFDGISGEGMAIALRSGRLAAEAISSYLATGTPDPLRRYDREVRTLRRNSDLLARLSLLLGRNPRLAGFAVSRLAANPGAFTGLTAISGGERGWSSLRPSDLIALMVRG